MSTGPTADVTAVSSPGEALSPDISTFLLSGPGRSVIVDPGPAWHVERHRGELESHVDPDGTLFAVILSPLPGCLSGLALLSGMARRCALVASWPAIASAEASLEGWVVRSPGPGGGVVPLTDRRRLTVVPVLGCGLAGAMVAYDPATQTLFTGPFFGSIGHGRTTGRSILRRESVRAYTEAFTPGVNPEVVTRPFGRDVQVARIGPAHGRLALGGRRLIETVFEADRGEATVPSAFYRLYLRLAGLLGEAAAAGIYQAAGVVKPDLERGYENGAPDADADELWAGLYGKMEQWLGASVLSITRMIMARLSLDVGLPLPGRLQAIGSVIRAIPRPQAREIEHGRPPRVVAEAGDDDLTDPVTGLLDEEVCRRHLGERLAERGDAPVSVLLVGVDNIERINQRFGRSGGDDALHAVSYLLRNYHSAHGRGGRHRIYKQSGPVLAYVLEEGTLPEATRLAEELRKAVSESAMFLEQITVSVGVASVDEVTVAAVDVDGGAATEDDGGTRTTGDRETAAVLVDRLLDRAQSRLRIARGSGRNTVCATDPEGGPLTGGANILVADPDAPYLEVLTRQLNARGYSVLVAEDGEDALDVIAQIVPDVIVCEAMLPKLNGFSIREELRHSSRLSEIPFILISHRKNDELIEKAGLLGIVHFLRKPFSLVELTGLLRNLTGGRAS